MTQDSRRKKFLTAILILTIVACGMGFQFRYHYLKDYYEKEITGFYRKYFNREPDAIGLRHWVSWALNRWSLEKVERIGFIEAKEKGAS